MKALVGFLRSAVQRFPVWVIVAAVLTSAVLGYLSGNAGREDGNEAFAPDALELTTFEEIPDLFGEASDESSVQVIVSPPSGDAISGAGLEAVQAVREAVLQSELAERGLLSQRDRPDLFVTYLGPVEQAVAEGRIPAQPTDAQVDEAYLAGVAALPEEQRGLITGQLLPGDAAPDQATTDQGLMLFFFTQGDASDDEIVDLLDAMANDVLAAAPDGSVEIFSFGLLFADEEEFQQETGQLFMLAGIIIVVILLFVFWVSPRDRLSRLGSLRRSAADMGLTIATIFMSISWMMGIGYLLGPDVLGLVSDPGPMTDIVPILIIGLGVDYSIHLSTRYKEEVGAGENVSSAIGHAIRTVGIALALATLTTAVGFLTNVFNPVPALVVFGVYAALGIAAAFVLMLTFVPAVRLLLDRRAEAKDRLPRNALGANRDRLLPRVIGRLSVFAERLPALTVAVALVLGGLGVWGWTQLETRFTVTDFVPQDNIARVALVTLQEDFGGGLGEATFVVLEGDVATAAAHNALVSSNGGLAAVPDVVRFNGNPAAESVVSVLAGLTDPAAATFDPEFATAAADLGLQPDLTVSADADVPAIYDRAWEVSNLQNLLHRASPGSYDAALFRITTQAGEEGSSPLRAAVDEAFAPAVAAGLDVVPTSDNIITDVIADALQSSQVQSLIITLGAAMLLLVINFWIESRRPFLGVITIVPVVLVVLWLFGLMQLTGIPFGPVTATIAAIAIGIGVPYTIHIAHRFQEDRIRCAEPEEAIASTIRNTGGALAGSAFTTAAGFGVLMTSSTVPFQQFGRVSVYAILLALLAAVLVLPSMLILWDRWHRRRGEDAVDAARVEEMFTEPEPSGRVFDQPPEPLPDQA